MTTAQTPTPALVSYLKSVRQPGWPILALTVAYVAILAVCGELRPEHLFVCVLGLAAWLASDWSRAIAREALPVFPIMIGFDSLRYLRPIFVTADRVHGCDLRAVELALFGVGPDTTLPDYFTAHHALFFDLLFAIPYGAFIWVILAYGFVLYFTNMARARVCAWAFVALYLMAFVAWLGYPAAPPWYIQAHGCVIDAGVQPSAAALSRVDEYLGIQYFQGWYGRGPTPYGAMPSVHNALAMLGLLVCWPVAGWKTRAANAVYVLWMICASVYLDHHWLIDGFAGWATAALAVKFGEYWTNWSPRR
jgi:hypothetical protein